MAHIRLCPECIKQEIQTIISSRKNVCDEHEIKKLKEENERLKKKVEFFKDTEIAQLHEMLTDSKQRLKECESALDFYENDYNYFKDSDCDEDGYGKRAREYFAKYQEEK